VVGALGEKPNDAVTTLLLPVTGIILLAAVPVPIALLAVSVTV